MLGFFSFNKLVISYQLPCASAPHSVTATIHPQQNKPEAQVGRSMLLCPFIVEIGVKVAAQ